MSNEDLIVQAEQDMADALGEHTSRTDKEFFAARSAAISLLILARKS